MSIKERFFPQKVVSKSILIKLVPLALWLTLLLIGVLTGRAPPGDKPGGNG